MNRLSARNQIIIAVAVLVAGALAFVFLGIMPMFREASTIDEQIATAKQDLANAQAVVQRRQAAKAQSAQNEVELMRIANRIPDSPQLPSVIIDLQDVANACGLKFPNITVGALAQKQNEDGTVAEYSALPITIIVNGDWADVIEYYRKLDKLDRGVRVTTSSFTYVPEAEETPAYVQANIVLEVYVMAAAPPMVEQPPAASQDATPPAGAVPSQ
jgi:Tfp pilus assembly protein PilO